MAPNESERRGKGQDFHHLRAQCLQRGILFEDPEFPANESSLYNSNWTGREGEIIKWKRPMMVTRSNRKKQIAGGGKPHFCVENPSPADFIQGDIGDCWLTAVLINLAGNSKLFSQVVPSDQSFHCDDYAGIFHFRFHHYGKLVDIVIDDRLPTCKGKLIYMHSRDPKEFLSALLEKAYAKFRGCYGALDGGNPCDALRDLLGDFSQQFSLGKPSLDFFPVLYRAHKRKSIITATLVDCNNNGEKITAEGLYNNHAYSVIDVKCITDPISGKQFHLLRLRNPWGNNEEQWSGAWADNSPEWQKYGDKIRPKLIPNLNGEFWMSLSDFEQHFSSVQISNSSPQSLWDQKSPVTKIWTAYEDYNQWDEQNSAGCDSHSLNFCQNPQYYFTIEPSNSKDNACELVVALMQKDDVHMRGNKMANLAIGFAIWYLGYNPEFLPEVLDQDFFTSNAPVVVLPPRHRVEVRKRCNLPQGTYCVVPYTRSPQDYGQFLLRVFCGNTEWESFDLVDCEQLLSDDSLSD